MKRLLGAGLCILAFSLFAAGDCRAADFDLLPPPENADFSPYLMTAPLTIPVEGFTLTSPFGWRFHPMDGTLDFHTGADMACPEGTRVKAALGGTVLQAEYHESYGNYILIDHGNGFTTLYAHCSRLFCQEREQVGPGEAIALSGMTGQATGPHLHFELTFNGVRLDPKWLFSYASGTW